MQGQAGSLRIQWFVLPITAILLFSSASLLYGQVTGANASGTAEQRADALLKKMTLEEKIGQLNQAAGIPMVNLPGAPASAEEQVRKGLAGSVLWVSQPADINRFQKIAVEESRLHIPLLIGLDVIHGYHTIFPPPLGDVSGVGPEAGGTGADDCGP